MVRMDIVAGLKNAVERGYSLAQAQQTLINSGYNQQEIQEASNYLTGGQINVQQSTPSVQEQPQTRQKKPNKKFPSMLVFLVFILLVLVSFLVLSIIFKEELINFLQGFSS
tara:strand:- start:6342 stop:6674 length:333 start_codon:yes stop_codon:yes gene_type:complete